MQVDLDNGHKTVVHVCVYVSVVSVLTVPKMAIRHMPDGSALGLLMQKLRRMSDCFLSIDICHSGCSVPSVVSGGSCQKTQALVLNLSGITSVILTWRCWHCDCCNILSAYLCYD